MTALPRQAIASHGIGGSEIAAALGLSPYKSPLELWLEKTGQRAPFAGNDLTDWGHDVEPALREWYARRHERAIWVPSASLYHPDATWCRATPDGIVIDADRAFDSPEVVDGADRRWWLRGFEAKNVGWRSAHRWGEPGTDEVPIEYLLQAQQGLAVTGLDEWDVVASIGGAPPAIFTVRRDNELIADMLDRGAEFWARVTSRTAPPIDEAPAWSDYLAERYPFSRDDYVRADDTMAAVVAELRNVREALRAMEAERDRLEHEIKAVIGEFAGMETPLGRLTWKPQRGGRITDWEAVARDLAANSGVQPETVTYLASQHTREGKSCRPLRTPRTWSQGRAEG